MPIFIRENKIVILAIAAGVLVIMYSFTSRVDVYNPLAQYEAAMRMDTIGGRTPEETFRLFVAALRRDDAERASEYFMLDSSLSRKKWLDRLLQLQSQHLLISMAYDLETHARQTKPLYEGDAGYELLNDDGTVGAVIDLEFNRFGGVWKLQSF